MNSVTGSDSNDGFTSGTALATLNAAVSRQAGSVLADRTVLTYAPLGTPLREQVAYTGARTITIKSQTDGVPWYLYASVKHTSGWASLGGGIYSKNIGTGYSSSLYTVVVTDVLDIDGQFTKLERDVTTPTTPAAGRFGWDSTAHVLYINLPDGSDPNTHVIEIGNSPGKAFSAVGTGKIVLHDVRGRFANLADMQAGDGISVAGHVEAYDSIFDYAGGTAGVSSSIDGSTVYCERTKVFNTTKNDGFSAHGASSLICVDCESAYNGGPIVTGTPQGLTAHETATVSWTRTAGATDPNAGRIHHNYGAGYIGAETPNVTIDGAEIDHNFWRQDIATLLAYQAGVSFQTVGMTGSVTNCNVHDNVSKGINRSAGVAVTIDAATIASSGVAHGNGAADTIL